jgi:outer membrane immunogenic protein
MKKLFLAGIAFIALGAGSSALAADLRVPYKAPPVVETWSWTGFYVGVHFGAAWGTKQQTITTFDTPPVPVTQSSHTVNGWLGGGQVGFNYQVDRWVWGV